MKGGKKNNSYKDDTFILVTIVIMLLTLSFISSISGFAIIDLFDTPIVAVSPSSLLKGDTLTISIEPETSVYNLVYVYNAENIIKDTIVICETIYCSTSLDVLYNTSLLSPGKYDVHVFDYNTLDWVSQEFSIEGKVISSSVSQPQSASGYITLDGYLEVIISENELTQEVIIDHILLTDRGEFYLVDYGNKLPTDLISGEVVSVTGTLTPDNKIYLDSYSVFERFNDNIIASTERGNFNIGEQKTLVIPVYFEEMPTTNIQDIYAKVFSENYDPDGDGLSDSINSWVKEVSYGKAWLTGEVAPQWYLGSLSESEKCDIKYARISALSAVYQQINVLPYKRLILVYPDGSCPHNGIADIGTPQIDLSLIAQSLATKVWLSTVILDGTDEIDDGTGVHEFGHTFGLYHAYNWECGNNMPPSNCYSDPVDVYDVMGGVGDRAHFNAFHKEKIGWLDKTQIVTYIPKHGLYTIEPYETNSPGIKMIKIQLNDGTFYSIEYRRPIGYDAKILKGWYINDGRPYEGAMVHWNNEVQKVDTHLFDLTPTDSSRQRPILLSGSIFYDLVHDVTIRVDQATPQYLKLEILGEIKCTPGDLYVDSKCMATIEAEPEDGYLLVYIDNQMEWDARNLQTADTKQDDMAYIFVKELLAQNQYDAQGWISRGVFSFDTRRIPSNSQIDSATLSLVSCDLDSCATANQYSQTDLLTVVKVILSNTPEITESDFSGFGSVSGSNGVVLSTITKNSPVIFNLNNNGFQWIDPEDFTTFGIIGSVDLTGIINPISTYSSTGFFSSSHPSPFHHPLLNIIYSSQQSSICGNGMLDVGEECDDKKTRSNNDLCTDECLFTSCGDGKVQTPNGNDFGGLLGYGYEQCDDGNTLPGDGCSNTCVLEQVGSCSSCSDGLCTEQTCENELQELCLYERGICTSCSLVECSTYSSEEKCIQDKCNAGTCLWYGESCHENYCGEIIIASGEVCDTNSVDCLANGGYMGTMQCNDQCTGYLPCQTTEYCGDGHINGNEVCDEGSNNGRPLHCNTICSGITLPVCPNGVEEQGEECDDGNYLNWDTCTIACKENICGDGYLKASTEQCDDANVIDTDFCTNTCKLNTVCNSIICTMKIPAYPTYNSISGARADSSWEQLQQGEGWLGNDYKLLIRNSYLFGISSTISRGFLVFDTSKIPFIAEINSATLTVKEHPPMIDLPHNFIQIMVADLMSPPSVTYQDFNSMREPIISTYIVDTIDDIVSFDLGNFISEINRNGFTSFGIKGGYDVLGIPQEAIRVMFYESMVGSSDMNRYTPPYLTVTFNAGCGNGIIEGNEVCEIGNSLFCQTVEKNIYGTSYDGRKYCKNDCSGYGECIANCGNGNVEYGYGEECDDGNHANGDGCNYWCRKETSTTSGEGQPRTGGTCFLEDTEIATKEGVLKIQDITKGDVILSYNEETEKKEESEVRETFKHQADEYIIINKKLKVTPNHPMHINNRWQEIGKAKIGDKIKTLNGKETIFSIEKINASVPVYNIEVEKNHNYYAENYLVHNKAITPITQ